MQRRVLILFAAAVVAVVALAGYLFIELSRTNTTLAATTADLTATRAVLADTDAALTGQRARNVQVEAANAVLTANLDGAMDAIDAWSVANATLTANLDDALDAIDEWELAFADKEKNLAETTTELNETAAELANTASALTASRSSFDALTSEHGRLQSAYGTLLSTEASLRGDYNALVEQAGDVETLRDQADSLREEIAELEAKRRPLVLSADRNGFSCTGSMEPKITCMDEATWLYNFKPEDIVVGATISFNPDCWENKPNDRWTAHRVMDIKVENGVHYYWPKGDSNPEADGCWVPEQHVKGYIIDIHKDVRPANSELRGLVNEAKTAYNEARVAYYALRDQYCTRGAICTVPSPIYERLVALGEALDAAWDLYDCWADVARDSEYPGHIPRRC